MPEHFNWQSLAKQVETYETSDLKIYRITLWQIIKGGVPVIKAILNDILSDKTLTDKQWEEILEKSTKKHPTGKLRTYL